MLKNVLKATVFATSVMLLNGAVVTSALAQVVYNRGNDTDPTTLDHHKTSTVAEANLMRELYEGLVVYDAAAKVVPGVAESWEVSDDGLKYTFKLRENAKRVIGPSMIHGALSSWQRSPARKVWVCQWPKGALMRNR